MAKRTKTPEEIEWEAGREWREQFVYRRLNQTQREMMEREQGRNETTPASVSVAHPIRTALTSQPFCRRHS
jgi:hypothetical protein